MVEPSPPVIHVVHVVTRTNIGGPSVILDGLLADSSNKIRYTIVRGETDESEGDYFADRSTDARFVTVSGLGRSISPISDLRAFLRLISTLRSLSPDVVHTHMAKAGVVGRLAAWIARVPVRVHTYHGHLLYGYFSPLKTRLVVLVERLLGAITTHVVVVGTTVRTELISARIIAEKHSTMIPPGIADVGRDVQADRCGVSTNRLLVGFVGRLTSIKRPDRFVEMARILLDRRSDVEFLVVGDGPLGDEVRNAVRSLPSIHCIGWRRDVGAILTGLDVLVLCSDNEGIPLSLIEAGHCATAVVATNVGSVHDVVRHEQTGLLTAKDPSALAGAVERLLDDATLRHSLGAGGREFSLREFSVESAQRRHRELYTRLVAAQ
jgi:glycosyltransferase involved in cell wall biosynthesis